MWTKLLPVIFLLGAYLADRNSSALDNALNLGTNRTIFDVFFEPESLLTKEVDFFLFTRDSSIAFPLSQNCANLKTSGFLSQKPTKIIIHGWSDSSSASWVAEMRASYLVAGDYNVICVNWYPDSTKEYLVAVRLTQQVGHELANLLKCLRAQANLEFGTVHLLGHSLGAHIASFAAKSLPEKIWRITGMDPARPSFESLMLGGSRNHLIWTDAIFVDVIHTCAGTLGFQTSIGHSDFYPNRGIAPQPGCPIWNSQSCSHIRSYQYMNESILNPSAFPSLECGNSVDFKLGRCGRNRIVDMGENADVNSRGVFFLETNPVFPFGKGE